MEFVHLEVRKDFENGVLNQTAAEWIASKAPNVPLSRWGDPRRSTGTITSRRDNIASMQELTAALDETVR